MSLPSALQSDHAIGNLFCSTLADPHSAERYDEFYQRSRPLFAAIARRVARPFGGSAADDIEDQIQEVGLRLTISAPTIARRRFAEPAAAQAYVSAVAWNLFRDTWKGRTARKRAVKLMPLREADGQALNGQMASVEHRILVNQLAARFGSARDRQVFRLHFLFGCTAAEIASLPGIGLRAKGVETLLSRLAAESRRYVQEPAGVRRHAVRAGQFHG